ncbi:fibronectin type III-like domain-contianing protein [Amycolatopsis sp. RTGN1]|nr:fibronectin type III-like domain-contianing protein [Amycolatopsis sp. RTGN1]
MADLEAGASTEMIIRIPRRELAYWKEELHAWIIEYRVPGRR